MLSVLPLKKNSMLQEPILALFGHMDKSANSPLYLQLQDSIRNAITEGILRPGEYLPPEREIGKQLEVSRVTVRKAIDVLVQEGLLVQRQGAGTYVGDRVQQPLNFLKSYSEIMAEQGKLPSSRWIDRSMGLASVEELAALKLQEGAEVVRFYRLRLADNKPMALEIATVPSNFISNPFEVSNSLYDALRQHGLRPVKAQQRLRAITIDAERAAHLQIPVDSATLYIERIGLLGDDTPVEYTRSYFPGDSYDFVTEIKAPSNSID